MTVSLKHILEHKKEIRK